MFQERYQRAARPGLPGQLDALGIEREIGDPRVARDDLGQLAQEGQRLEGPRGEPLEWRGQRRERPAPAPLGGREQLTLALELARGPLHRLHLRIDAGDLSVEPSET